MSIQLEVLTPEQLKILIDAKSDLSFLNKYLDELLLGGGSVDNPSNAAFLLKEKCQSFQLQQLLNVLEHLEYPTSTGYGPTGKPCCPKCDNSLQNGTPSGSPQMRRCADCKSLFRIPNAQILVPVVHASLEKSKNKPLGVQEVVQILNNLRLGDHPDDAPPEKFVIESTVWTSTLLPWCLQWHTKSYKEYVQDFLDGKLNVDDYNFCIDQINGREHVWSYIMGEGSSQMLTRRLFPDEDSLMKCYNAIGVKHVKYGVG